jgi:hypothetical protein
MMRDPQATVYHNPGRQDARVISPQTIAAGSS